MPCTVSRKSVASWRNRTEAAPGSAWIWCPTSGIRTRGSGGAGLPGGGVDRVDHLVGARAVADRRDRRRPGPQAPERVEEDLAVQVESLRMPKHLRRALGRIDHQLVAPLGDVGALRSEMNVHVAGLRR